MKLTKKKIITISIICVVFIGYLILKPSGEKFDLKDFDTEVVKRGDIVKTITANGTINPVNVVEVGTQVSGTIEKIYVDYNDVVVKGQKLAELDTSVLKKSVAEAESTLKKAKATLDLAILNYKRNKTLFKNNYIAKVDLDEAETEMKTSREEYNIAKAGYDVANINLGYAFINSPVSGVIISREVDVGQTVASSLSAPTLFEIAEDLTKMQIETSVSEGDIGSVKEGQKITFTVDSFPDKVFQGSIKQVRLNPTTSSNVVVYNVIIEINNDDKLLMPGMTAYVTIPVGQVKDVKKVSIVSLRFNPDERILKIMGIEKKPERQNGNVILYKLVGKKVAPVYVKVGLSDLSQIEIQSDELQEGDTIITNSTLITTNKKK
ncbi:MAG TPA: efflux RND transporter periplasmic adaptor subunit [Rickettsiales bacterium]|nr:efflux RND transporter periplasmic adaptor subunit [Rickettsiales bacterium]